MPFVLVIVGLLFLVVAIRGTQGALFSLVKSEFQGTNSFIPWAAAIFILGAIGYVKTIKPVADGMIGLVILSMLLANKGGFFTQLNAGLQNPVAPAATTNQSVVPSVTQAASQLGGASGGSQIPNTSVPGSPNSGLPYVPTPGPVLPGSPDSGFWD